MFVDNLLSKINDAIQNLAKMLDLIHKFASKQREQYFSIIKNLQTQLNTLKANLKESNALQIQKQYNTIYLNINSLGSEIQDCSQLLANKQNRDHNRVTPIRQSKRNQEQAFRLIAEKEDQINRLKLQNFEKEELIKINYQQLMDYKKECCFLNQQCKLMKNDIAGLETQISRLNEELLKKEQQLIDLKLVDQQRERFLRSHLEELDLSNKELEAALQKIHYFQHLAEISMNKTQVVEQNIKQLQSQALKLQQNYKVKQNENIKNNRKIQELEIQLRKKQTRLNVSQQQNRRITEDMSHAEQELTKLNQMIYGLKIEHKRERQSFNTENDEITQKLQIVSLENQNLRKDLKICQDKFVEIFNKYSQMQEEHQNLKVSSISIQKELTQTQEQVRNFQNKARLIQKQLTFITKEKQILNQQLTKSLGVNKQLEVETNKLKQLLKAKQSQRIKLSVAIQNSNTKLKYLQRDQTINQRSIKSLTEQINDYKLKIVRLQQGRKYQSNEIQGLKMRLLKAKIQTIHQLRNGLC